MKIYSGDLWEGVYFITSFMDVSLKKKNQTQ